MDLDRNIFNREGASLDLNHYIPYFIRSTANRLARAAAITYGSQYGIRLVEWSCISLLAMEGAISATRISEISGYDKAAISRSVNLLESKGLVASKAVKNHNKRRLIELTATGRQLHSKIAEIALAREKQLLRGLSDAEQALFIRLIRLMNENAAEILDSVGNAKMASLATLE